MKPERASTPSALHYNLLDAVRASHHIILDFMLPNYDDMPTLSHKFIRLAPIAAFVIAEFLAPKRFARFRRRIMFSAPVPKAAVHEYRDLLGGECYIRPSR